MNAHSAHGGHGSATTVPHEPVFVGDLVSFWTETVRIGNTSITVKVVCEAIRGTNPDEKVVVTEAHVVYVNVGDDRKPAPIKRKANAYSE